MPVIGYLGMAAPTDPIDSAIGFEAGAGLEVQLSALSGAEPPKGRTIACLVFAKPV